VVSRRKFKPVAAHDVNDDNPAMVANHLRSLQREVRAGFELLGNKLLVTMERMDARQDAFDDQLTMLQRRIAELEAKSKPKRKST